MICAAKEIDNVTGRTMPACTATATVRLKATFTGIEQVLCDEHGAMQYRAGHTVRTLLPTLPEWKRTLEDGPRAMPAEITNAKTLAEPARLAGME